MLTETEELRIPLLRLFLLLDSQVSLTHRNCEIWGSLEHLEMTSLWTPSLSDLYTSGASTDDGAFLAFDWDLFIRPEGGVVNNALEFVDAWPIWYIALRSEASADDQILGFCSAAVCSLDIPAPFIGVELRLGNNALESSVALDIQHSVTSIEIVPQVVIVGVIIWPVVSALLSIDGRTTSRVATYSLSTSGMLN